MRTRIVIVKRAPGFTGLPFIRVVAGNGEILLVSETYSDVDSARRAARSLKRRMPLAKVVELGAL